MKYLLYFWPVTLLRTNIPTSAQCLENILKTSFKYYIYSNYRNLYCLWCNMVAKSQLDNFGFKLSSMKFARLKLQNYTDNIICDISIYKIFIKIRFSYIYYCFSSMFYCCECLRYRNFTCSLIHIRLSWMYLANNN